MNEDHAADMIEIGVDLGIFTISNLLLEGATLDQAMLQKLSDLCATHIEEVTGMPAEDFALKVKPIVDQTIKIARGRQP